MGNANRRVNVTQDEETRVADIRRLAEDRRSRSQNSSVDSVPDGRLDYTAYSFIDDVNYLMKKFPDMGIDDRSWMYHWTHTEKKIVLSFYLAVFVRYELDKVNNEFHEMIRYIVDDVLRYGRKYYEDDNWNAAGFRSMFSDLLDQTKYIEGVDKNKFKPEVSKTKEHVETLLVQYQWCYKEPNPDAEEPYDSVEVAYPDRPNCTPLKERGAWTDEDRRTKKKYYLYTYHKFLNFINPNWRIYLSGLFLGYADPVDPDDIDVRTRLKF